MNLVLACAYNYKWDQLKIFIKTLRKFYSEEIIIASNSVDNFLKNKFKKYNITNFIFDFKKYQTPHEGMREKPSDICQLRYSIFFDILNNISKLNKPDQVLLCDCRDIFFQDDPFKYNYGSKLNFFLEENIIENDARNKKWLIRTVGNFFYNKIKNNLISCSGTTLGNYENILLYTKKMKNYLLKYPFKKPLRHLIINKKIDGYDQGLHNFIIYNNLLSDFRLHENQNSNICTTAWMKEFNFDKNNYLLNKKNEKYSTIHQYDRCNGVFDATIKKIIN